MNDAPVELHKVGKTYDNGVIALTGIDFHLNPAEIVAVVGPSGCGKSTLLRLMAGLETPTTGRIVRGAAASAIGYIFQEPTLLPWATAKENIALPLKLGPSHHAESLSVAEALAMVRMTEFAAAYPRELSGGMKMRVALARALITKPHLLLLDEPFAAIDEIARFQLDDQLLTLWRQRQFSAVFVTHSIFEAVYLAHRVVVMSKRPGHILGEVAVEASSPRSADFRNTQDYMACCGAVTELLRQEITL